MEPIVGAVSQYHYRNKLEYAWTTDADGPALGFHEAGRWDEVLDLSVCLLTGSTGNAIREAFVAWARDEGLQAYDQAAQEGFLRHLVVREGLRTGEALCILVTEPGRAAAARAARGPARRVPVPASSGCCTRSTTASPRSPAACRRGSCSAAPGSRRRSCRCGCGSPPGRSCRPTPR